jgi:hypothetical protein
MTSDWCAILDVTARKYTEHQDRAIKEKHRYYKTLFDMEWQDIIARLRERVRLRLRIQRSIMLTRRSLLRGTAALPLAATLSGVWKWLGGCKPEAKFASHLTDGTTISTFHSNSDPPTGHD